MDDFDTPYEAQKLLGITDDQAEALFYLKKYDRFKEVRNFAWPKRYEDMYLKATTPEQRGKAAVARIRHFINTGR
jgi:hypothetical protein